MSPSTIKTSRIVDVAALLVIGVLAVYIMIKAQFILVPFAWAIFIALLIMPLTKQLEQYKFPRWLAIITVLVVVTVVVLFLLYLLSVEVAGLLSEVPAVSTKLDTWLTDLQLLLENNVGISHEVLDQQIANSLSDMINTGLSELRNSLFSAFRTLTLISVIPLYIFFLLYYRDLFYNGFLKLVENYQERAHIVVNKVTRVVQQYLTGLVLVTIIMGGLFYAVLAVLGIGYAFFFAVLLAVFNLIPYIGVILSSLIVVLYAIVTTDSMFYPVAVLLSLWMIQMLENNLITPYVIGSRVKINPLAALIAIFAGASIWGVSGMILFIPLLGAMKVIFDEFKSFRPLGMFLGKY